MTSHPRPTGAKTRKPTSKRPYKPTLVDPFADKYECSPFATLPQGATEAEISDDLAKIRARIAAIAAGRAQRFSESIIKDSTRLLRAFEAVSRVSEPTPRIAEVFKAPSAVRQRKEAEIHPKSVPAVSQPVEGAKGVSEAPSAVKLRNKDEIYASRFPPGMARPLVGIFDAAPGVVNVVEPRSLPTVQITGESDLRERRYGLRSSGVVIEIDDETESEGGDSRDVRKRKKNLSFDGEEISGDITAAKPEYESNIKKKMGEEGKGEMLESINAPVVGCESKIKGGGEQKERREQKEVEQESEEELIGIEVGAPRNMLQMGIGNYFAPVGRKGRRDMGNERGN